MSHTASSLSPLDCAECGRRVVHLPECSMRPGAEDPEGGDPAPQGDTSSPAAGLDEGMERQWFRDWFNAAPAPASLTIAAWKAWQARAALAAPAQAPAASRIDPNFASVDSSWLVSRCQDALREEGQTGTIRGIGILRDALTLILSQAKASIAGFRAPGAASTGEVSHG